MSHFARPCISLLHRSTWNTIWQRTATCRDLLGDNSALESVLQWPMAAWCDLLQRQLSGLGGGERGLHGGVSTTFCVSSSAPSPCSWPSSVSAVASLPLTSAFFFQPPPLRLALGWMLVSLQISKRWNLLLNVMIFGGGVFKEWLGREGGALMKRISALMEGH